MSIKSPIDEFLKLFTDSTEKTLSQNLDKDTYKTIGLAVEPSSKIKDLEALKQGCVVYKTDFASSGEPSSVAVLIPEELLASISDVMMGGTGDAAVKEQLGELEINAARDLLKKIFKGYEAVFKFAYSKELTFSADPLFAVKEMPEYASSFEDTNFDLLIPCYLKINDEKEFEIKLLFNEHFFQGFLSSLGILKQAPSASENKLGMMDIAKLADIEIEITAELGRTSVPIKYALELVQNSVVELDTLSNSDIKVFANGVEVALAQVVAVEDNFGLKITKIISPEERLGSV